MRRWALLVALFLPSWLGGCLGGATPEPAEPGGIVAFGDSYTSGTGARAHEAYPAVLGEALGVEIVNAGVHGETAREALSRFERDVLSHKPKLVIVEFGVNEAFRGQPVEHALSALDEICERVRASGAQVVLVGVHFRDYQENFDEGLEALAKKHDAGLVLDVLDGVLENPQLRSDQYHPNAKGYALMAQRIQPEVERVLQQSAA